MCNSVCSIFKFHCFLHERHVRMEWTYGGIGEWGPTSPQRGPSVHSFSRKGSAHCTLICSPKLYDLAMHIPASYILSSFAVRQRYLHPTPLTRRIKHTHQVGIVPGEMYQLMVMSVNFVDLDPSPCDFKRNCWSKIDWCRFEQDGCSGSSWWSISLVGAFCCSNFIVMLLPPAPWCRYRSISPEKWNKSLGVVIPNKAHCWSQTIKVHYTRSNSCFCTYSFIFLA